MSAILLPPSLFGNLGDAARVTHEGAPADSQENDAIRALPSMVLQYLVTVCSTRAPTYLREAVEQHTVHESAVVRKYAMRMDAKDELLVPSHLGRLQRRINMDLCLTQGDGKEVNIRELDGSPGDRMKRESEESPAESVQWFL